MQRASAFLRKLTAPNDNQWGSWKNPEAEVWAGILNHAEIGAVLRRTETLPWRELQWLQVLLKDQEELTFRLYMFDGAALKQYAPIRDDETPRSY